MKKVAKVMSQIMMLLLLCAAVSGCGSGQGVATDGSTSMSKLIGLLGEAFEEDNGIGVTFNATGSGAGIQAVLEGRCDIGLSSRELKEEEKAGGLVGTVVAYDGIAVIVNPANPIRDMDMETIAKIYRGQITDWSEVGGQAGTIVLIGREAGSGTRDGFESIVGVVHQCRYRQELTSTGDVIMTVASNPNAIGYASVSAIKDSVRPLTIGGVSVEEKTVQDGTYAMRRPFLLVTRQDTQLSDNAQKFFDYIRSERAVPYIYQAGVVPVR